MRNDIFAAFLEAMEETVGMGNSDDKKARMKMIEKIVLSSELCDYEYNRLKSRLDEMQKKGLSAVSIKRLKNLLKKSGCIFPEDAVDGEMIPIGTVS